MRNHYFKKLWRHNKVLCLVIIVFMTVSTLLSKSVHNPYATVPLTPFYTWEMFSAPYIESDHTTAYELVCDGETLYQPAYLDHKKMFYTYTITKFDRYAQHNYTDDRYENYKGKLQRLHIDTAYAAVLSNAQEQILQYPAWLKSYLSRNLGRELKNIKVFKHYVHYDAQGIQHTDSSVKLLDI
ncbi:MAG: hypothetical protein BGO31_10025 [Bacteroidetes bacterium 43-16]|nr:MAG: hypothetical protein BGO31_10025 [Bacteroidetes bacterium 43-16]